MNDSKRNITKAGLSAALSKAVAIEHERIEQIRADDIDKVVGGEQPTRPGTGPTMGYYDPDTGGWRSN